MSPLAVALAGIALGCGDPLPRPTGRSSVGPIELAPGQTVGGPSRRLDKTDGPRFSGVASLNDGACTASYVVPAGLDLTVDGPAYLLTAAHCPFGPGLSPHDIVPSMPGVNVARFRDFGDSPDGSVEIATTRVDFASIKGTDLAVLELALSREGLRARGIVPFVLSDRPTVPGEEIAFAGHPSFMPAILSACHHGWRAPMLVEQPFHFFDAEANDCADLATGASGSPVFLLETGMVVAVVNTKAEAFDFDVDICVLSRPCEAGSSTLTFREGTNYAVPVGGLAACFDGTGHFDARSPACPLDRGNHMVPVDRSISALATPGTPIPLHLELEPRGQSRYRTLVGPAASTDCRDARNYGAVVSWADAPAADVSVPGEPGVNLVCILAGPGPDPSGAGWQDPNTPTMIIVQVYAPPP